MINWRKDPASCDSPFMQAQKVILLHPTHEQTASFHVEASLAEPFLQFLKEKGISAWEPPHEVPIEGPDHRKVVEVNIEADTDVNLLEKLTDEFLASPAAVET